MNQDAYLSRLTERKGQLSSGFVRESVYGCVWNLRTRWAALAHCGSHQPPGPRGAHPSKNKESLYLPPPGCAALALLECFGGSGQP